ncbi:hypothetical protein CSC2_31940 [Clostridium zeae]|uniref:ABC transporter permease n=1 Tax=Clostridium zeae TaxID=2759022 RepID=A0ABQ1EDA1_9CLOT|nr:ABC transporter permease [Clostridium zeae]GFZ32668.1 hypothetical protein CSC2_31940 [Clostridium zeae]
MRNIFVQAYKALRKRRFSTRLIIAQLSICIVSFLFLFQLVNYYNERYNRYNNIFEANRTLTYAKYSSGPSSSAMAFQTMDYLNTLKNKGKISDIMIYRPYSARLVINNENYLCYQVSSGFFNKLNINIAKGRSFTDDELDYTKYKEDLPIIIGSKLGEILKVGDVISDSYDHDLGKFTGHYKRNFKVVGIAKPGSLATFITSTSDLMNMFINDYGIYSPLGYYKYYTTYKTEAKENIAQAIEGQKKLGLGYEVKDNTIITEHSDYVSAIVNFDFQVVVNKGESVDSVKAMLAKYNNEIKGGYKIQDIKSTNGTISNVFRQLEIGLLTLTIVLFFFSIVGITGTTLYSINLRHKEFGIRLSQGARLKDIAQLVLAEVFLKNLAAFLISVVPFKIFEYFVNKNGEKDISMAYTLTFDYKLFIILIALILGTTFISVIIPIRRIMKLDIVELVRK